MFPYPPIPSILLELTTPNEAVPITIVATLPIAKVPIVAVPWTCKSFQDFAPEPKSNTLSTIGKRAPLTWLIFAICIVVPNVPLDALIYSKEADFAKIVENCLVADPKFLRFVWSGSTLELI